MQQYSTNYSVTKLLLVLQSAYHKGHSTESALYSVLDEIVGSIDNGYTVALMSLDVSAAFDAVPHDILIQQLKDEFGVTGRCCQ